MSWWAWVSWVTVWISLMSLSLCIGVGPETSLLSSSRLVMLSEEVKRRAWSSSWKMTSLLTTSMLAHTPLISLSLTLWHWDNTYAPLHVSIMFCRIFLTALARPTALLQTCHATIVWRSTHITSCLSDLSSCKSSLHWVIWSHSLCFKSLRWLLHPLEQSHNSICFQLILSTAMMSA